MVEIIAEGLKKSIHEIFLISTKPIDDLELRTYNSGLKSYYNLGRLPKFIRPLWHFINIFNIQSYFKIKKILKKEKPDLVMTHNLMGVGFLTSLAIRKLKIKHIHTLHDIQLIHPSGLMFVDQENKINNIFAKFYQAINKKLFSKIDIVISPSEWLMNLHKKGGFFEKAKKEIIINPIASKKTSEVFRDLGGLMRNKQFTFLYVGQLEKHKGIEVLIQAFTDLNREDFILKIVGESNPKLQVTSYNTNNIQFLGKKSSVEVKKIMQQADCLVVPSLCYENYPTVILEAGQAGLPAIGSNIGGILELLPPEFLFKAGDAVSLKNKMQWAIEHKDELRKILENSKSKLKENSVEKYIEKILSL